MQKNKSILNQKCNNCGHKINFFKMKEQFRNENKNHMRKATIILSIILGIPIVLFINRYFYWLNKTPLNEHGNIGLWYGFGIGFFIAFLFLELRGYHRYSTYSGKRQRKALIHSKIRWAYWHSLSNKKKKSLIMKYVKLVFIAILPYLIIVFIGFTILNAMENDVNRIRVMLITIGSYIGLYFITGKKWIKYLQNKLSKECRKIGIDYQRFNRGVKSK